MVEKVYKNRYKFFVSITITITYSMYVMRILDPKNSVFLLGLFFPVIGEL